MYNNVWSMHRTHIHHVRRRSLQRVLDIIEHWKGEVNYGNVTSLHGSLYLKRWSDILQQKIAQGRIYYRLVVAPE